MSPLMKELSARWNAMSERERLYLTAGGAVVGIALLWSVLLGPALRTMREAPVQRQALQLQLLQMQRLAAESRELRAMPTIAPAQAGEALKAATARLGEKAKLVPQGERSVLSFNGLQADQLRTWLAEARSGARARPVDVQISRGTEGLNGTITMALGGAP